ncbi:2-iminoacetate synthase ThiH [Clostridium frigidicarnis]|uniref:Tyrosine lyase ThiH n=1 Tax=Clostridium frigidicarnis TaxID=84698 RepID=A0A1I0WYV3_9CLOT|nr:2-iminoacetate synthase ThiH [Clostridium frigidicarnis]SFA93063.1 tyrosine lyase ThiH [Clostridium frigidicarnis]
MSFYNVIEKYRNFDFSKFWDNVKDQDIKFSMNKSKLTEEDFLILLSPKSDLYLEDMARKANELTNQYFGKTILLYTPLYIANYCVNKCAYCGYNIENNIIRKKLNIEEIESEAKEISEKGFKHILLLTGESPKDTPVEYIGDAVKVLKKYFSSVSIEVFPMKEEEYRYLIKLGVDGITVYQEVYDEEIYSRVHLKGPKRNYKFRLDAPEEGCRAGIRSINIGALLGLNHWRKELFFVALHGLYLQKKYGNIDVSFSLPRIRPHAGIFEEVYPVDDKDLVQGIIALRIMFPNCGINISTREEESFRNNLIPLGITKMSAGVSTAVGGHTLNKESRGESQFEINDSRSELEVKTAIRNKGYEPIFKDWINELLSEEI